MAEKIKVIAENTHVPDIVVQLSLRSHLRYVHTGYCNPPGRGDMNNPLLIDWFDQNGDGEMQESSLSNVVKFARDLSQQIDNERLHEVYLWIPESGEGACFRLTYIAEPNASKAEVRCQLMNAHERESVPVKQELERRLSAIAGKDPDLGDFEMVWKEDRDLLEENRQPWRWKIYPWDSSHKLPEGDDVVRFINNLVYYSRTDNTYIRIHMLGVDLLLFNRVGTEGGMKGMSMPEYEVRILNHEHENATAVKIALLTAAQAGKHKYKPEGELSGSRLIFKLSNPKSVRAQS